MQPVPDREDLLEMLIANAVGSVQGDGDENSSSDDDDDNEDALPMPGSLGSCWGFVLTCPL